MEWVPKTLAAPVTPSACDRGGWEYVATAAAGDRVRNVLRAAVDGKDVRERFERQVGEALSERWPLVPGQT